MSDQFRLIVVSGLSGSGKSLVLKCFEDMGFFCVDNLPPRLFPAFIELFQHPTRYVHSTIGQAAIGMDIRERDFLPDFLQIFEAMKQGVCVEVLFLDAQDEILCRRFSETRRPHPLAQEGTVLAGIKREREMLEALRQRASRILDTSAYNVHQLREIVTDLYADRKAPHKLHLSLVSFGYKHGIPMDVDLLFDVRFLANPYFQPQLQPLTGEAASVQAYLMAQPETGVFLEKLYALLDMLLPFYEKERRRYLTIGVGCTGGQHRSVAIVCMLNAYFKRQGRQPYIRHRDTGRENV